MKKRTARTDRGFDARAFVAHQSGEVSQLKAERDRLLKKLAHYQDGGGLIVEAVAAAFAEHAPQIAAPPAPAHVGKGRDVEVAVVHLSDVQYGKRTASYNSHVADERIALLGRKVEEITALRRNAATIRECRLYVGGDIVEGEDIFPGQAYEIDQGVFDQAVRGAPTAIASLVLHLLRIFERVHVVSVSGNHGRNGRKGSNGSHKTNWDSVASRVLELMLLGPHAPAELRKRLTIVVEDERFYNVDRVFDWGNLVVHGDQITGGFAGFPWYGTAKKAWGWIDSIPAPWDYLWFGHFHTFASAVLNHRTFLANGTTESDNAYAQAQLAAAGFPCQRLSYFNRAHGLIADHQVFLSRERRPHKMRAEAWRKAHA
jgi:hypothetical protein